MSFLDHAMQSPQTEARIAALEEAVRDIRDAVVTIARLEERHAETREAISRCFQVSEKNAEAILAVKAESEAAFRQIASDATREAAVLRNEVSEIKLKIASIEGRMRPLEELRGFVVKAMVAGAGVIGLALLGLVVKAG